MNNNYYLNTITDGGFSMAMNWNMLMSDARYHEDSADAAECGEVTYENDYDTIISSTLFRRLQDKAQVFPLEEDDYVRTRLTHSLEVSAIGKKLGEHVFRKLRDAGADEWFDTHSEKDFSDVLLCAGLVHDIGNPPFGHSGERAISTFFSEGKGLALKEKQPDGEQLTPAQWEDLTHFEGNANAFRLLTHQFEGRRKGGFVLTYSTLASIVKYPFSSSLAGQKSKFGFFTTEEESFRRIAEELGMKQLNGSPLKYARHPLVYLVEAADDICYQMMDIEDAHKLKILTTQETQDLLLAYFPDERKAHILDTLKIVSDTNEQIAYLRSSVIGLLIGECTRAFLDNEVQILEGEFEGSLIKHITERPAAAYQHCAEVSFKKIYRSRDVLDIELAGFRIISTLLELMIDAVRSPEKAYSQLLINRVSGQYNMKATALYERIQAVLDYISGMTDVFALDLYRKINGNSLPAV